MDIGLFRKEFHIDDSELSVVVDVTGISRTRLKMIEYGLASLNEQEEALLRLACAYVLHCRSVALSRKLAPASALLRSEPMTWPEYLRQHEDKLSAEAPTAHKTTGHVKSTMKIAEVSIELLEENGSRYFPIDEPVPWDIVINTTAAAILRDNPALLESMIKAIRGVITS